MKFVVAYCVIFVGASSKLEAQNREGVIKIINNLALYN